MTNTQQGLNDLSLAGIISLSLFITYILLSGVVKLIGFVVFKIKINLELKKDKLRSLSLKK